MGVKIYRLGIALAEEIPIASEDKDLSIIKGDKLIVNIIQILTALFLFLIAIIFAFAQKRKMSMTALWINAITKIMAPDRSSKEGFDKGIENNRKKGPAFPPPKLQKKYHFRDYRINGTRLFRLDPKGPYPGKVLLFYLHGGAYIYELQSIQWNLIGPLLTSLPSGLVIPLYPLAPESSWKKSQESVLTIYRDIINEPGVGKVVLVGDSSGGGLALSLVRRLISEGLSLPDALVLFSPWLDLSLSGKDQPRLDKRDPLLSMEFLHRAGSLWAKDLSLDDPRVSPLWAEIDPIPPTILFSGDRDLLDSDALRWARRNRTVRHFHYPEMLHIWPAFPMAEGKRALLQACSFIAEHTL